MIDTDKYEGHTSDWKWIDINEQDDFYLHSEHGDIINHDTPDGKLAQDAPLLLEEVKRLQGYEREHKELWDIIANFSPKDSEEDNDTYQEWLDSVSQGYMGSVYEYVMMKQEEMIE